MGDPDSLAAPIFTISGPGGSAETAPTRPAELTWTTLDVPLDPAQLDVTEGTWSEILAHVDSLRVGAS